MPAPARGAMAPLDLASVAADVSELYEPLAEEKNVTLTLVRRSGMRRPDRRQSQPDLPGAGQSGGQCDQIHPARRAGDHPARLLDCQGVELAVADSGPGIPPQERPRVTERFVRLEASRHSPGTGLGLSLVAAVAHFHDAAIAAGRQCAGPEGHLALSPSPGARCRARATDNACRKSRKARRPDAIQR